MGLNGVNYRLLKDNLEKDIVPGSSKFIVKRDKVVIKLQKVNNCLVSIHSKLNFLIVL